MQMWRICAPHAHRTHACREQGRTRLGKRQSPVWGPNVGRARSISHAISDSAADTNPALRTEVVLSPLKRCCHNAFVSEPTPSATATHPLSPAGEREHACHLMVGMYNGDTAGQCGCLCMHVCVCVWWGDGVRERRRWRVCSSACASCRSVWMFGHAFVFAHISLIMWPCIMLVSLRPDKE